MTCVAVMRVYSFVASDCVLGFAALSTCRMDDVAIVRVRAMGLGLPCGGEFLHLIIYKSF